MSRDPELVPIATFAVIVWGVARRIAAVAFSSLGAILVLAGAWLIDKEEP